MRKPLHPIAFVAILWTAIFSWSKLSSSQDHGNVAGSDTSTTECTLDDALMEVEAPSVVDSPM